MVLFDLAKVKSTLSSRLKNGVRQQLKANAKARSLLHPLSTGQQQGLEFGIHI